MSQKYGPIAGFLGNVGKDSFPRSLLILVQYIFPPVNKSIASGNTPETWWNQILYPEYIEIYSDLHCATVSKVSLVVSSRMQKKDWYREGLGIINVFCHPDSNPLHPPEPGSPAKDKEIDMFPPEPQMSQDASRGVFNVSWFVFHDGLEHQLHFLAFGHQPSGPAWQSRWKTSSRSYGKNDGWFRRLCPIGFLVTFQGRTVELRGGYLVSHVHILFISHFTGHDWTGLDWVRLKKIFGSRPLVHHARSDGRKKTCRCNKSVIHQED